MAAQEHIAAIERFDLFIISPKNAARALHAAASHHWTIELIRDLSEELEHVGSVRPRSKMVTSAMGGSKLQPH